MSGMLVGAVDEDAGAGSPRCRRRCDTCGPSYFWPSQSLRRPLCRRLDALGVKDGGRGRRIAAFLPAQHHQQMVAKGLPHAGFQEGAEVPVDRGPGRKGRRGRQMTTLEAGRHYVEQGVQQPAQSVLRGRPPGLADGIRGAITRYWSSLRARLAS